MLSLGNQQTGGTTPIVLKDRLLTDSVVFSEEFPSIVNGTTHGITATTTHNGTSRYFNISNTMENIYKNLKKFKNIIELTSVIFSPICSNGGSISSGSSEHSYSSGTSFSPTECQVTVSGATKIQVANGANKLCSSSNAAQMWGTAAGSDGDSMPESPLSLDDGKLPPSIRTTKFYSRLKYIVKI